MSTTFERSFWRLFRVMSLSVGGLLMCQVASYSQPAPRIGYIYPAGGQAGTTFEVLFGGQYLDDSMGVLSSGEGVTVEVLEHNKLPPAQVVDDYRDRLREVQQKLKAMKGSGLAGTEVLPQIRKLLREADLTEKQLLQLAEYDRRRNDPKQQLNSQIGETVRAKVKLLENAEPGIRYLRLRTPSGLSNPLRFVVGQHHEVNEAEPESVFDLEAYRGDGKASLKPAQPTPTVSMPAVINGRILPGEVDEFTVHARKGEQVVVALQARNLMPYLADAVPGWFQAVVSLHDPSGYELAYADGYRFDPDPVLFYKIPAEGDYSIRVHDSIYRGREDFVYRITIGELPFLTGISPLGASAGSKIELTYQGGNLGADFKERFEVPKEAGITLLHATVGGRRSNLIPFQIGTFPEEQEREPNNSMGSAAEAKPPAVINGRIEAPGDADFYRVKGRGNRDMVFEVFARRLGSPVDASLAVFDSAGEQIAFNDDHEDLASGLTTHHADSRIRVKLPPTGDCIVRVTDTQNQGGIGNAYRLKVHQAEPSFALRVTPASVNAKPGTAARLTVHALRVDGYTGPITLRLKGAPPGFEMKNGSVPEGQDRADVSIAVPSTPLEQPVRLTLEGVGQMDEDPIVAEAVPAEDMMQAFIYRHLVPVDALLVDVRSPPEKPSK